MPGCAMQDGAPCANSVTTQKSVLVSNESSIRMMFSCLSVRKISISCRSDLMSFSDFPCFIMNFMATICPVYFLRPLKTCSQPLPVVNTTQLLLQLVL